MLIFDKNTKNHIIRNSSFIGKEWFVVILMFLSMAFALVAGGLAGYSSVTVPDSKKPPPTCFRG